MVHITIKDRPCGWGKSTEISRGYKANDQYITVVPLLTEVDRAVCDAQSKSRFTLHAPNDLHGSKKDHVMQMVRAGQSIACTHALFYRLGTLATEEVPELETTTIVGLSPDDPAPFSVTTIVHRRLDNYNLIIDEVVDPFDLVTNVQPNDFKLDYVNIGMATVDGDGKVAPTGRWDERYREGGKTFDRNLYEQAKSGALYVLDDQLFILTIPLELLLNPKTVTIYTYLSAGTILRRFLEKLEAAYAGTAQQFTLEIDSLEAQSDAAWRADVASALTIKSIPPLERYRWSFSGQSNAFMKTGKQAACRSAGNMLKKFGAKELNGINRRNVLLTCRRDLWFDNAPNKKCAAGKLAKHSRLFGNAFREEDSDGKQQAWDTTGVQWLPNTTRGVNDYIHCTHAVYLYDQNPNPRILQFLDLSSNSKSSRDFRDAYALAELVQWLFRSCIRSGGINGTGFYRPRHKATVYIPSERMRNLLTNWLATGAVCSLKHSDRPNIGTVPAVAVAQ